MAAEHQVNEMQCGKGDASPLKVSRVRQNGEIPLSYSQEQIWFLQRLDPDMTAYNLPRVLRLRGVVDGDALERAFKAVIERHAILRTQFFEQDGVPVQLVVSDAPFVLQPVDISNRGEDNKAILLDREIDEVVSHVFDLRKPPALIAKLIKVEEQQYVLAFCMHHIASDGWSNRILANDLSDAYRMALASEGDVKLSPLTLQYGDFTIWQREQQESGEWDRQLVYWNDYLGPAVPSLDLSRDRVRSPGKNFDGEDISFVLPKSTEIAMRRFCKDERLTPFVPLLAAWQVLLSKWSGQQDFTIGVPHAGRSHDEFHNIVGYFINPMVFRARLAPGMSWRELCRRIRSDLVLGMGNIDLPFERLLAERPERGTSGIDPLFQTLFDFQQNIIGDELSLGGLTAELVECGVRGVKVDLSLHIVVDGDQVRGRIEFSSDLFTRQDADSLKHHFICSLIHLVSDPEQLISSYVMLVESEQAHLTAWGNNAERYPDAGPVHRVIESQVKQNPEAIALVFGDEALSYAELNARANRLAHRLIALDVGPEVAVGVALERSVELVVSLLAILKAGGAYVPLDPDYPTERLAYMVEDSGIDLVLTHSALRDRLPLVDSLSVVEVDALDLRDETDVDPTTVVDGENLAYVIYTSGSTGRPKGVGNRHRSLSNRLIWMQHAYALGDTDTVLQKTPYSFDVSVWEFFWPLMTGARLAVANPGDHRDPARLVEQIQRNNVTTLHFVPSMLQAFLAHKEIETCSSLERIVCSGEALPAEAQSSVFARLPEVSLYNLYGPTEAAIDVTHWTCRADGRPQVPIGRPIADTTTYVLDESLNLGPRGVAGELYLGGVGLARGYLNRADLTAERFIADPFGVDGGRLYRTGDLVRWNAEGQLEYLGRIDHQVKIRGFRIELGEIEAKLLAQPEVREAVVVADEGPGGARLVGYVALTDPVEIGELRERLGRALPEYMVPGIIMVLEALPLNANGKIDRKALPAPEVSAEGEYEAPVGELEESLAAIWAEVLEVEQVGRNDDYFRLGGHSLLALKLLERIRVEGHAVQVRTLFEHPRLRDFAAAISKGGQREDVVVPPNLIPEACERIEPEMVTLASLTEDQLRRIESSVPGGALNIQDIYPLAPLQEGILFHHLLQEQGDVYVTSHELSFDTKERLEGFIENFNEVIARHDILRTAVLWEGLDEPVQVVYRNAELAVQWVDTISNLAQYRIDVRQAPLIHALAAFEAESQHWRLQLFTQHLVTDHTTLEHAIQEIGLIQSGLHAQLVEAVPFRQFVAQARLGVDPARHESYFKAELGDVDEPTAPFGLIDVRGDGTGVKEGRSQLAPELAQAVRVQAKRYGVSAAALFHLAWAMVLGWTSGRDDVVFGTVLFGRMQGGAGAERALGMFVNMLPLRVKLGARSVRQCLKEVQAGLTALLHHEHATLSLAQKCSGVPEGTPLFSAMLNYRHAPVQKTLETSKALASAKANLLASRERTNYPFELTVDDSGQGFELITYIDASVDVIDVGESVMNALSSLVMGLAQHAEHRIDELDLLSEAEGAQLMAWGGNAERYKQAVPVHHLVEAQVRQNPQAIALVIGDDALSYEELNARSNRLAHRLIGLGVSPEARVGVALERSVELIVSLLAILKAGGAYVPLDLDYPSERLAYMVENSGIELLVTHSDLRSRIPVFESMPVLRIDELDLSNELTSNCVVAVCGENLAYVIYTSGSTGMPKGVMVAHGSLTEHLRAIGDIYGMDSHDRILQFASFSFDAAVEQWLLPLIRGSRVILRGGYDLLPQDIVKLMRRESISTIDLPPMYLAGLLPLLRTESHAVSRCIVGGEVCPPDTLKMMYEVIGADHIFNSYGPTEAVITPAVWRYTKGRHLADRLPIGRPVGARCAYVLNSNLNLVPVGVSGELYLGGVLARGYLSRPIMTADRFVADPFGDRGGRLYRTGDLVRWNAQGELEYLGRIDHQVKIRGFRIELGEIEAKLLAQPEVREAVVVASEGPGGARLVAYVSLNRPVEVTELRERLGRELPEYMVPGLTMVLEALPLNANGKIDRKALPAPEASAEGGYEAPVGELEEALAAIWAEVLEVPLDKVGRRSNFFELGGDSILSLQVVSRASVQGYTIALRQIFEQQTIKRLARGVRGEGLEAAAISPLTAEKRAGSLPLSYAQQRLWFLWNLDSESTAYHIGSSLQLAGELDGVALSIAFEQLVRRHEALRTIFRLGEGGHGEQIIQARGNFRLEVRDVSGLNVELEVARIHAEPFDLKTGPLLRAVL
ncbi:MAG: amino acid adenylation domain-containing protein, partial [Alcaligenes sp.]